MNTLSHLIDTSALARIMIRADLRNRWLKHLAEGVIAYCDVTELEFMFSAQSLADRLVKQELLNELFAWVPTPDNTYVRARRVQQLLTDTGKHRSAGPVDLLVAATAELSGLTLLHHDRDFETIAEVTGQPTEWVAPPRTQ